jgi:hypothetical protein
MRDARMKKILGDTIAVASTADPALEWQGQAFENFQYYGQTSAWLNPSFVSGFEFAASASTFSSALGSAASMYSRITGARSQSLVVMWDAGGQYFDGSKTYQLVLPPNIPAGSHSCFTIYDSPNRGPVPGARATGARNKSRVTSDETPNDDGSTRIFVGPSRPKSRPNDNWIQTDPDTGWFAILRMYNPLPAFFDKTWQPSEIVEVRSEPESGSDES